MSKKIMFSDKFGLTQAVLEGRKTQTRRIIPARIINYADTTCFLTFDKKPLSEEQKDYKCYKTCDGDYVDIRDFAAYRVGEIVAIAQSYKDAQCDYYFHRGLSGWNNKMFVRADEMPHRIRITNVRVERLQDISEEDCLNEGISVSSPPLKYMSGYWTHHTDNLKMFNTPREAFATLIDKTCGKGTWDSNPWVFVYDFELLK